MSSNDDFNGPSFRPARGRGADDNSGGANGGGGGQGAGPYPEPEGWGQDGFWRDSAIDSNYETGFQRAVRPSRNRNSGDPGYSYWAEGKGWENSPGTSGQPDDATSLDATRAAFGAPGTPGGAGGFYGAGADQTDYLNGPGWPGGPGRGGPGGPRGRGPGRPGPGGPGGPGGKKRKGSWWRHWTWKKALAVTGGVFVFFILCLFGIYQYLSSSAVIPAALASANYQNTVVYYSDGTTVLGTIGPVDRQDLTFNQIPKSLQDAVLAAEDRSFWTEGAISPTGILRAAYDDLTSGDTSGGSTITQEFVRNYYQGIGTQQTISRKIKEIFVAQKLAATKSKQWILTNYLNLIYLGENSYGVAAAAQTYFGEPVSKLTVAQDAVIAAIIQQPSTYPLLQYRSNLINRWHYVLNGMVSMGDITQAQANAMKFPKLLTDSGSTGATGASYTASSSDPWAPYIMNVVYNELTDVDHISQNELEYGGLKVVTTISRPMEVEMYKAVNQTLTQIPNTSGATVSSLPSWILVGAELQNPKTGAIIAMYPGRGQDMSASQCKVYDCDDNTAVYTREQVGSSFKPYVLSAAVEDGMNVQTSTLNAAPFLCVPPDYDAMTLSVQTKTYGCPSNLSSYLAISNDGGTPIAGTSAKTLYGSTVQNALAQSSNTAFTDLTHRVTTTNVIKMAQNYGVNISPTSEGGSNLSQMVGQVGLALGTASLTVNEQTTMLSAIDDNGVYHAGHVVSYWQSPDGPQQDAIVATHPIFSSNPTTNANLDSQVQYAMEETTVDGTGTGAATGLGSRPIIGKTGTTTNFHSGFFIGAIPQYSLVVGMFTNEQNANSTSPNTLAVLGGGGFGGYWPALIWNAFAQAEFANLPYENFLSPVFTGAKWDQVPKPPAAKKTTPKKTDCTETIDGKQVKVPVIGTSCPTTPAANPAPGATDCPTTNTGLPVGGQAQDVAAAPDPTTTSPTPNPTTTSPTPNPTTTSPTPNPTSTSPTPTSPTPTDTTSCANQGGGTGGSVGGAKGGLAIGGVLLALPGSLLAATASRRKRRRRTGTAR